MGNLGVSGAKPSSQTQFVSPEWLNRNLDKVVVLDATFFLPTVGKDADETFEQAHIPSAQRWNIDAIRCNDEAVAHLPHMMPNRDEIAQAAGKKGISPKSIVVVYDQLGLFSAPRVWFTLKLVGHQSVFVLAGGLPAWVEKGYETQSGLAIERGECTYKIEPDHSRQLDVCGAVEVLKNLETQEHLLIDARPANRFLGIAPEPRAGMRSGHIPNSFSVPYDALIEGGQLREDEDLRQVFKKAGVDLGAPIMTSCGSGVTAAVLSMALWQLGIGSKLYDGSWAEWGDPASDFPIEAQTVPK